PDRRAVRKSRVREHQRREVRGEETAGMSGACGGEGDHPQTERRNRVQTRSRQRYPPQRDSSEEATAETYSSPNCQLVEQRCDDDARLQLERRRGEQQHEDDG